MVGLLSVVGHAETARRVGAIDVLIRFMQYRQAQPEVFPLSELQD